MSFWRGRLAGVAVSSWLLAGCPVSDTGDPKTVEPDADTDADTDSDTDADTDVDTEDTDTETDTEDSESDTTPPIDTGCDSGDTSIDCQPGIIYTPNIYAFCAAGGTVTSASYTGRVCLAPLDIASGQVTGTTHVWQAGPIYGLHPSK